MNTIEHSDMAAARHGSVPRQYLTFMLGGEVFAVGILAIKEIIEYGSVNAVPMMPAYVRGVINLRGAVVPVADLSARFSRKETGVTRRTCIVIVEIVDDEGKRDMGIMVDGVNEVMEIGDHQIKPAPSFGTRLPTDCIAGMGEVDGKFVILLNLDRLLSFDDEAGPVSELSTESLPVAVASMSAASVPVLQ